MVATLVFLSVAAFVLSLILTPVVRALALRWNLVDLPDNKRKIHKKPVARIGGVSIFGACLGSCVVVAALVTHNRPETHAGFAAIRSIAPAAVIVFLTGLADDIFNLKPWHKLAAEILAASLVISAGVRIHGVAAFTAHPVLGVLATVTWLLVCTNAVNLIDGLDGLAAGMALLAATTTLMASVLCGSTELTIATAPLAGALLGFLVFNFNPASIFLGDSGSLFLGFVLGCYGILWSGKADSILGMAAPLIALGVPLLDTTLAIARRFLRAQPIFSPDRSHIHHRLLALGLTQRRAVLLLYIAAAIAGALSLGLMSARNHWELLIIVVCALGAMFGIRQLGYIEFEMAGRIVAHKGFRREINAQLAIQSFEQNLCAAATADDCWEVIQRESEGFGFYPVGMQFAGRTFVPRIGHDPGSSWAIHIPIADDDWIELCHEFDLLGHATAAVSFAGAIRKVLTGKNAALVRPARRTA